MIKNFLSSFGQQRIISGSGINTKYSNQRISYSSGNTHNTCLSVKSNDPQCFREQLKSQPVNLFDVSPSLPFLEPAKELLPPLKFLPCDDVDAYGEARRGLDAVVRVRRPPVRVPAPGPSPSPFLPMMELSIVRQRPPHLQTQSERERSLPCPPFLPPPSRRGRRSVASCCETK